MNVQTFINHKSNLISGFYKHYFFFVSYCEYICTTKYNFMKIGICNDHAGVEYKNDLVAYLTGKGYEMVNFGTDTTASMDYPDVAHKLASAVENGEVDLGIAFCGTGNGMQMALNKHQGIRAGLCWSVEIGKLIKQHNNANVLVMPARFIPFETVIAITDAWLNEEFEGGRHQNRIDKIPCK